MDGSSYVKQPQRSLANSFRLDPVGSAPANLKQVSYYKKSEKKLKNIDKRRSCAKRNKA